MDTNSTSAMLAKMQGCKKMPGADIAHQKDSDEPKDVKRCELNAAPQSKPAAEMQNVLTNSLGAAFSKDYTPMD